MAHLAHTSHRSRRRGLLQARAIAFLVLAAAGPAALAQSGPAHPADGYAKVRVALAAWGAESPIDPEVPVLIRLVDLEGGPVDRNMHIFFAGMGLAFGAATAVVAWPIVLEEPEGAQGAPVGELADAFRYGFFLPVAVGGTVLAGYSVYRLVVLL